jgi:serine protease Do
MTRFPFARCALAASLVAAFAAAGVHYAPGASAAAVATGPSPAAIVVRAAPGMEGMPGAATAQPAFAPSARGSVDFSDIVERYGPAVVNVSVTGRAPRGAPRGGPGAEPEPDDALREFLRRFGPPGTQQAPRGEVPAVRGLGSGFIVSADGLILTNAHVVEGAEEIVVRLTDRREFRAKLVGADPQTDVAVLRIEARNLPTVKLGDPSRVKVGEPVLAIGSPYGFENTVTAGIVSAKSRSLPDDTYVPFLQTDVAVNPGNSGGPLFDARGEVIGINSQIYSRTGGFQGLSFAIPIDVATRVQGQLVSTGRVERGRLGVSIQELDQSLARAFGMETPRGALVTGVAPGSPGAAAGLRTGDVIVALDGRPIDRSAELPARVAEMKPGQRASIEVLRERSSKTLSIIVGTFTPEKVATASDAQPPGAPQPAARLGLAVRELRAGEGGPGQPAGLLVESAGGPAGQAGIRPGDRILSVNGTAVSTVAQLRDRVSAAGDEVALLIQRNDARVFVSLRLAA